MYVLERLPFLILFLSKQRVILLPLLWDFWMLWKPRGSILDCLPIQFHCITDIAHTVTPWMVFSMLNNWLFTKTQSNRVCFLLLDLIVLLCSCFFLFDSVQVCIDFIIVLYLKMIGTRVLSPPHIAWWYLAMWENPKVIPFSSPFHIFPWLRKDVIGCDSKRLYQQSLVALK